MPILLLLAVSCGDDDGGAQNGASATPSEGGTPAVTAAPDANALEKLAVAYLAGVDGKISYRYETENFGQHPNGTWTTYRLSGNYRQDYVSRDDDGQVTTIIAGEDLYTCTKSSSTSCSRALPEHVDGQLIFFRPITEIPSAIAAGIEGVEPEELPAETIAGVEASCFHLDVPRRLGQGPAGSEDVKICFSNEGALLFLTSHIQFENSDLLSAELKLNALEVGPASASDFEPLAPP